eukprot:2420759-Amphidinium_carterae.1
MNILHGHSNKQTTTFSGASLAGPCFGSLSLFMEGVLSLCSLGVEGEGLRLQDRDEGALLMAS